MNPIPPETNFPRHLIEDRAAQPSRFHLFGMGHRRKLLYREGSLCDAGTGEILRKWEIRRALFDPPEYRVSLDTAAGPVALTEDEEGVWLEEDGDRIALTRSPVHLPRFEGHPHAGLLRALHAELLVNIMPFGPVPNLLVYPRPWYRDAALMLMCFEKTGNLGLVEPWVMGLTQVFDYNNRGIAEADNPGELLYMLSLVSDRHHPLVDTIVSEVKRFETGGHILGMSDYNEHPVYQTKWLKYGLRALEMEDPYRIPKIVDYYSSLFWMDYREAHLPGPRFSDEQAKRYPYLRWAEAHFYEEEPPVRPLASHWPLTWEARASEAQYFRMDLADPALRRARIATPHTWHAAEMFLYFIDRPSR